MTVKYFSQIGSGLFFSFFIPHIGGDGTQKKGWDMFLKAMPDLFSVLRIQLELSSTLILEGSGGGVLN